MKHDHFRAILDACEGCIEFKGWGETAIPLQT